MRLLAGRYRLVEQVGQGGTAVVWRAVDELLNRRVAVKMLAPGLAHDRASRALIRAEAQIAAQLNHPHVANVYDYGEARAGGSRRVPYLVLEFVDGETLASRLRRRGAMDWPEAVRVCADVATALAATHAAGLVHRDVKPGNVLLSRSGVKLVDLGIALAVGAESANSRAEVRGTPSYMAPEQLCGGAAVPASDLYALGLVLYARASPGGRCAEPTEPVRNRSSPRWTYASWETRPRRSASCAGAAWHPSRRTGRRARRRRSCWRGLPGFRTPGCRWPPSVRRRRRPAPR